MRLLRLSIDDMLEREDRPPEHRRAIFARARELDRYALWDKYREKEFFGEAIAILLRHGETADEAVARWRVQERGEA